MSKPSSLVPVLTATGVAALVAPSLGFTLLSCSTPKLDGNLRKQQSQSSTSYGQEASTMVGGQGLGGARHMATCGVVAAAVAGLAAVNASRSRLRAHRAKFSPYGGPDLFPEPTSAKTLPTLVGADVETGSEPWDPLGFSKLFDRNFEFNNQMTYPHVLFLREAELKHGRLAMLAVVGICAQGALHIPGRPIEPDWTKALVACVADPSTSVGLLQIAVFIGVAEALSIRPEMWVGMSAEQPGDFGWDPLGFGKKEGFDMKKAQLQELKNGRLAMIGFAGFLSAAAVPGSVPLLASAERLELPVPQQSAGGGALCGSTKMQMASAAQGSKKTAARYTTQVILPALTYIKTGVAASSLQPGELKALQLVGNDVLVGKDESGAVFAIANLCPHIGTPLSEGAEVVGDIIVCPLHGSSWNTKSGELVDWCVSPPLIGPLTGLVVEKRNIYVFDVRSGFFGGELEVLVDTNAKKAYEKDYWKGILDAQGKNDGSLY